MQLYFAEMLPIPGHLLVAGLSYLGIDACLRATHGLHSPPEAWTTTVGIWSVFNLFAILRLMDEIKDLDSDRSLFPERPLPSGRVLESDIRITLRAAMALYLGVNATLGPPFVTALVVLGWAWLMYRWFYIPGILRANLMLAFATHQPIVGLMLLHGFSTSLARAGIGVGAMRWPAVLACIVMIWCAFAGWEIARKTRHAEEETRYVTYSRVLGRRGAVAFGASFHVASAALALYLQRVLHLPGAWFAPLAVALLAMLGADALFLLRTGARPIRLRKFAEAYLVVLLATQAAAFGWRAWGPG
ncbi:MAG: hypothetical protein AB7Q97_06415 [Gammaproteobacteria bacterium]